MTDLPESASTEARHPRAEILHAMAPAELVDLVAEETLEAGRALLRARRGIGQAILMWEESWRADGRVILLGAGTSGRLAVMEAVECRPTFGIPADRVTGCMAGGNGALLEAVEGAEDDRGAGHRRVRELGLTEDDLVIGVSASGGASWVLGGLDAAADARAATILLTCVEAPVVSPWDLCIALDTGPEVVAGSTRLKAGTATKAALNAITTGAFTRLGKVYRGLMVDVQATNQKLKDRARRIVEALTGVGRREALRLLEEASGSAKLATVMHHTQVGYLQAQRLLDAHDGHLGPVLEPEKSEYVFEEMEEGVPQVPASEQEVALEDVFREAGSLALSMPARLPGADHDHDHGHDHGHTHHHEATELPPTPITTPLVDPAWGPSDEGFEDFQEFEDQREWEQE